MPPPDLPFRLAPGGRVVRVIAVAVPASMPAGLFTLGYWALSRRDPSSIGSFEFALTVTAVEELELVLEPGAAMALAGDNYSVKLRVTNRGNSRLAVQIAQRSSLGFPVSVDATNFALKAGVSRLIVCRVQTEMAFAKHTRHAATFDITATSATGQTLTASQASVVEILPLSGGDREPFHRLPMQLRLIGIAETGHDARFQAELSGAGSLDEAGKQRVPGNIR